MGALTGLATRTGRATGKHGGPGRACSIALVVLVEVPRNLAGQELVVLDGARAGLAAHGAPVRMPFAIRLDALGQALEPRRAPSFPTVWPVAVASAIDMITLIIILLIRASGEVLSRFESI